MTAENYKKLVQSGNYNDLFSKKFTERQLNDLCNRLSIKYGIDLKISDYTSRTPHSEKVPTNEFIYKLKNELYKAELITIETLNKETQYYCGGFEVFEF